MQDRKRLEEQIAQDGKIAAMTSDLDTLLELGKEGEKPKAPSRSWALPAR